MLLQRSENSVHHEKGIKNTPLKNYGDLDISKIKILLASWNLLVKLSTEITETFKTKTITEKATMPLMNFD